METSKKWKSIVKISQQGGGKKLNNGIFILLFTFMFFYLLAFTSFGASCSFDTTTGKLEITGSGELTRDDVDKALSDAGNKKRSDIKEILIGDGITSIGDWAFSSCKNLQNIKIPDSVTTIGEYAFDLCYGLTSVTFGDNSMLDSIGEFAFSDCNKLQNIKIPDNVNSIGDLAFFDCQMLRSIILPKNVSSIGEYAFAGCGALQSVYYTGTKAEWDKISIKKDGNDELKNAKLYYECKNPKYLTLKKIWKDGGDGSKRGIPQFVLKKNGVAIQTTDYKMDACLYEDIRDVFELTTDDNGQPKKKITAEAKRVDTWVYKFIVYDYDDKAKYAVEEEPMEGYKSEAFKEKQGS